MCGWLSQGGREHVGLKHGFWGRDGLEAEAQLDLSLTAQLGKDASVPRRRTTASPFQGRRKGNWNEVRKGEGGAPCGLPPILETLHHIHSEKDP